MEITGENLRDEFLDIWPGLQHQWPMDQEFDIVEHGFYRKLIIVCSIQHLDFHDYRRDCDNFASLFCVRVNELKNRIVDLGFIDSNNQYAMGRCLVTKHRGINENHALVWTRTDKGIYLLDPQLDLTWPGSGEKDFLYFTETI